MGLWHKIKKGLSYAAFSYALLYSGTAFVAGIDYKMRHRETLIEDPPPPAQDIRSFLLPDGRLLTILGENHIYNQSEAARAPHIARSYDLIAHEGGGRLPLIFIILSDINFPAGFMYTRATGRGHRPTIRSSAGWGHVVDLETGEDSYRSRMTNAERAAIIALSLEGFLTAPFVYFEGRSELEDERQGILDNEASWLERKAVNLEERDAIMARNLAQLVEERSARRILCVVGRWHINGVIQNLEQYVELTPTGNPDFEE